MHSYTYWPDGSLKYEKDATGTNVMKSYTYTDDGQLASATFDGKTLANKWDANNNRVRFTVGSNINSFVYDTTAGIPAVIKENGVYYIREPGGSLIARKDDTNISYYHFDQLGSTRMLTDNNGTVTDKYAYDAYGALITHDRYVGSVDQPYQYVGQLGYYTHYQEPDFGLLQLGVRFYDPSLGRFTQRDPIERLNLYYYADCRPLLLTDALGLAPKFLGCTANQEKELKKHIYDILNNRLSCITGGSALRAGIESRLKDGYFRCGSRPGEPPCTGCGYTDNPTPRMHIHICNSAFNPSTCGCLGRTIIHELAHASTTNLPGEDPEGYQCENDCYGKGKLACPK